MILEGINQTVEPHEKVGVVGRTGAGKSTMMIALFRITDLCEGSIAIDGIDLATLDVENMHHPAGPRAVLGVGAVQPGPVQRGER